jgi:hypothetical protein
MNVWIRYIYKDNRASLYTEYDLLVDLLMIEMYYSFLQMIW